MLTPDASVAEARAELVAGGHHAAIVEQDGHPIGIVTLDTLGRGCDAGRRLGEVMDWECLRIAPDADPIATLRTYTRAAWTSLYRRRPGLRSSQEKVSPKEETDASNRLSRSRSEGLGRGTRA